MAGQELSYMLRFNILAITLISLVFNQERDQIFFPHNYHIEDEELTCEECHGGVELSVSVNDHGLLPLMDGVCADCHEDAVDEDSDDSDCELCHTHADDPLTYAAMPSRNGPAFSHVNHLATYEECQSCHSGIDSDDGSEAGYVWKNKDCQSCHEYQKPKSHLVSWKSEHGLVMNDFKADNCSFCHDNNYCDNCHQYEQFTLEIHNSDYLSIHGMEASAGVYECSTCHSREEDCSSCHRSQNVMPMNHNFPNWAGIFLPKGGEHGSFALEAADVCQVCHESSADPTCLRCHGETR